MSNKNCSSNCSVYFCVGTLPQKMAIVVVLNISLWKHKLINMYFLTVLKNSAATTVQNI